MKTTLGDAVACPVNEDATAPAAAPRNVRRVSSGISDLPLACPGLHAGERSRRAAPLTDIDPVLDSPRAEDRVAESFQRIPAGDHHPQRLRPPPFECRQVAQGRLERIRPRVYRPCDHL